MSTGRYRALPQVLSGLTPPDGVCLQDREGKLEATVAPAAGGEISSLRCQTPQGWRELLYRANDFSPTPGWEGRAPLLWPAVGRNFTPEHLARVTSEGTDSGACSYRFQERVYDIPIHGFARGRVWRLIDHGADHNGAWATCQITDDPDTRRWYPFAFTLRVTHRLTSETLTSRYLITAGTGPTEGMFFSIGNHLSLQLPFTATGSFDRCLLISPGRIQWALTPQSLLSGETQPRDLTAGEALANPDLHNLVLGGFPPGSIEVILRDPEAFGIRVAQREIIPPAGRGKAALEDFYFVFWGDPETGLYCPEPWYGGPNSLNTHQGVITLAPGDTFEWEMEVTIQR